MEETKKILPVIPLRGITVFPNMIIHFDIGRDKSLKAVEAAMQNDERVLLVTQKDANVDDPTPEELFTVGTIVKIKQVVKLKPPTIKILVEGENRAKLTSVTSEGYLEAVVEEVEPAADLDSIEAEATMRIIDDLFEEYGKLNTKLSAEMIYSILSSKNQREIVDLIIANIPTDVEKKQQLLETESLLTRMEMLVEVLQDELEVLTIQNEILTKVKKKIDKHQKEYYLREQLKVIQEELGEQDGIKAEVEEYRKRLATKAFDEEIVVKLEKEMDRLLKVPSSSPESGVIRTYIETVLELPGSYETSENIDLKKAKKILDEEHYGLEKVKERILEYLAVRKMSNNMETPIVCLVGPPGVGKTSIAKSIAHAINRNYVRISLGGVRDEAEIRGHRRTYVGAMPGRFVMALKQAQSNNPVMLLDEVDKMMGDFRGDPAAALLEVLDSGQNSAFRDHYLELPLDLSNVLFIVTANTLSTIPRPLLDRMEVIEVNSYTTAEKLEIAKRYLLPIQLEKHGLKKEQCKMSKQILEALIEGYTREAGVRNLDRVLGTVCRKCTKELIELEKKTMTITEKKLGEYLGSNRFSYKAKNQAPEIGVVRGLAWTSVGGDTLSIEVNIMPGKGNLDLTGNMGTVMKESAKAAISYIRSQEEALGIEESFYKNKDIHIHIPEGAVPKDGPSAGITMATAIISALTGRKIRDDLAMTGEITIRGRVLPIGGLKEKILAAKRAGIFHVIVPKDNEKDIVQLDSQTLEKMEVIYAKTMEDVLLHVFADVLNN